MNVLHRPHPSPNRRARPMVSPSDAKVRIVKASTMLIRGDRADAPTLPFPSPLTERGDANMKKSSAPSSSSAAASAKASFETHGSRSASAAAGDSAAKKISPATTPGLLPGRETTTAPAGTIAAKLGTLGGGRSLHLLLKRSISHPNRYQSMTEGSEAESEDEGNFAATSSSRRIRDEGHGHEGGGEATAIAVRSIKQHATNSKTTTIMMIVDGSDSTTDEGYDGFAAGSWHSQQEQQRQSASKATAAAPNSPQSVIIYDAAAWETAASPSTPYSRRSRRRRSSMPMMGTALTTDLPITETTSHPATTTSLAVACNWTDPARRTLWVTSPGSSRAHLEFSPRSFVETNELKQELSPGALPHGDVGTNHSHGEVNGRDGPSFHGIPNSSSSASPARTGRRQYQRRHSVGVSPTFPAWQGLGDNTRSDSAAEMKTAVSTADSDTVAGNASKWSSWHAPVAPTPPEEELDPVAASHSPSGSASSTSSPRRKTRRTATARHITSRRRGRPSSSASSSVMQHLQVPVV